MPGQPIMRRGNHDDASLVGLACGICERLDDDMSQFAAWDSFYVIVGSAAGALIGLQFVVVTLIADRPNYVWRRPAPHLRRRPSFISAARCFCPPFCALHGKPSSRPQLFWAPP